MKKSIILLIVYLSSYNLIAQYTAIPDYCFEENLINNGLDTVQDGFVLTANISNVSSLHLNLICGDGISDLTGIQDFGELESLEVIDHQLTKLDLSMNLNLRNLRCMYNQIDSLNVTMLTDLEYLECYGNPIPSIVVTNNTKLKVLEVGGSINQLDLTNNLDLVRLYCYGTQVSNLDVRNNVLLEYLNCAGNEITELDLTENLLLIDLNCSRNNLTELDLSNNLNLESLTCGYNSISSLNVSINTTLEYIVCYGNEMENLIIEGAINLRSLDCQINKLSQLNLANNSKLKKLVCRGNELVCLNVKNGNNINIGNSDFYAYENPLLNCIEVDDPTWSADNWNNIDSHVIFSDSCDNECSTYTNVETYHCKPTAYPNPNNGTFSFNSNNNDQGLIKMYNMVGIEVFSKEISPNCESQIKTDLGHGMYLLRFIGAKSEYMHKIIIK